MARKSKSDGANAKKPFYKRIWFIAVASIFVIAVISSAMGGGSSTDTSTASDTNMSDSTSEEAPAAEEPAAAPEEPALEITARKLVDDLEANALNAKTSYDGKLIKVTGTLGNIDASGKYFSLDPDDGFYITSVQIYIDEALIPTVSAFSKGQSVTVTGKITDVGELLGYSVDAISIP